MFFDWILVLMGFSPNMVYAVAGIHLLIAYWHHTQLINKLGWVEKVFVTPAHHRVHHGVNPQYLDKTSPNSSSFGDRIFGTFAPEEEEVCYGLTHPPRTWDPIYINIQFWKQSVEDCIAAPNWWDKSGYGSCPWRRRPWGLDAWGEKTHWLQPIGTDQVPKPAIQGNEALFVGANRLGIGRFDDHDQSKTAIGGQGSGFVVDWAVWDDHRLGRIAACQKMGGIAGNHSVGLHGSLAGLCV